jgi:hypothetical protein
MDWAYDWDRGKHVMHKEFWWGNIQENVHFEDHGGVRIILKWTVERWMEVIQDRVQRRAFVLALNLGFCSHTVSFIPIYYRKVGINPGHLSEFCLSECLQGESENKLCLVITARLSESLSIRIITLYN